VNRSFARRIGLVGAVAVLLTAAAPAYAQGDTAGYATWTMSGTTRDYTGTMALPGNFPAATFTSDGRADSSLRPGTNTWLGENTPFGGAYGSSRDQAYPLLRPRTDTPGNPSTTTYTFATATPASGWGFALGDIDADRITITATGADGSAVPVGALGYQGSFNFCETSPKSTACSGVTDFHTPTWTAGTATLSGDGDDETGGTGWFQPTVPITTLTFSFSALSGFPVYQTWFAKTEIADPDPTDDPSDGPGNGPGDGPGDGPGGDPTDDPNDDPSDVPGSEEPVDGTAEPVADASSGAAEGPFLPSTGLPLLTLALSGLAALALGALSLAALRSRGV